ncbi:MAG: peptidoglycan-binding protein [Candidatus Omnitrophica bacterium]|nr:peptidoglycan-binding protein [Candidatus Omnitrophota bacterium]
MRKFTSLLLCLCLISTLWGCSKKEKTLEQMQQPMSPEDLNRLKTATSNLTRGSAKVVSTTEQPITETLPPPGPYAPTPTEIQTALANAGYYKGAIDGKIGPKTQAAIEAFQRDNGLAVDGKVGPKTWAVLSKYLVTSTSSKN